MVSVRIPNVGNKREIPPGLPPYRWLEELRFVAEFPDLSEVPFVHPVMEYLSPEELIRFRAQALVWRKYTGDWPEEVAWWWPVRKARRRGDVPHTTEVVEAIIDSSGTLHCGLCGARWSSNTDTRCKLCDRLLLVVKDEKEESWL
tara:strand:+ start:1443 stop:1877 length:435 start_codon:yes stop_codon:yes gene_type:complete